MSMINLLPDDYLKRRWQRRASVICLFLFAVVIVGVLDAAVVSERNAQHTLDVRDNVNEQYAEAARLIKQMQELERRKAKMIRKADLTSSLIERVPRSTLLAVVTNALPTGASLKELELANRRIVRARPSAATAKSTLSNSPKGRQKVAPDVVVELTVTGLASTDVQVARFIAAMARNPLMETVELDYSKEITLNKTKVREFKVVTTLRAGVDAIVVTGRATASAVGDDAEHTVVAAGEKP